MVLFNDENLPELVKALFASDEFKEALDEFLSDRISDAVNDQLSGINIDADNISGFDRAVQNVVRDGSFEVSFSA